MAEEREYKFSKDAFTGHDRLGTIVMSRFRTSAFYKMHKTIAGKTVLGWEKINDCSYNRIYLPEEEHKHPGVKAYFPLVHLKTNVVSSWLSDLLVGSEDAPFTLSPTPVSSLPKKIVKEVESDIAERLLKKLQENGMTAASVMLNGRAEPKYTKKWIDEEAKKLKETKMQLLQEKAKTAAQGMQAKITDVMVEGGWRNAMAAFYHDFSLHTAAFLSGPVAMPKTVFHWQGSTLVRKVEMVPQWRCVRPENAFPSPDASSAQDGGWFCEVTQMSRSDLLAMKDMDGANKKSIDKVLETYGGSPRNWIYDANVKIRGDESIWSDSQTIDVVIHQGMISGKELDGIVIGVDAKEYVEFEAYVIGGYTIFARAVPTKYGKRTYYSSHYAGGRHDVYGESMGTMLFNAQNEINDVVRARWRNIWHSAGPIYMADINRFDDPKSVKVKPFTMLWGRPDINGNGVPALRMEEARMHATELTGIVSELLRRADDHCGIPAIMHANPQMAGMVRTSGAASMLFSAAQKQLKSAICNIDMDLIEPSVTNVYTHIMEFDKDESIKADAKVVARGANGILKAEMEKESLKENLAAITQAAQGGVVPNEFASWALYKAFGDAGLPVGAFMDNPKDFGGVASGSLGQKPPQTMNEQAGVKLDGRSNVAPGLVT